MSSFRPTSPPCIIALQQLTGALETTKECIDKWFNNEDSAPIDPHNALSSNRKSFALIQAVFEHNSSQSAIDDAVKDVEGLRFEVTKCRGEAESAFRHIWYLYDYDVQSCCTPQGHESVENLASVSTRVNVRTLELISSRIAECPGRSVEDHGDSNDPIQWLQEQVSQTDFHHPPISTQVLLAHDGEDTTPGDGSRVRGWVELAFDFD